ncbi:MAG: hypothetical protein P4L35_11350, partial [Ignavibacteriaceae bacterium]|nr:hypothetical protein [Ignavibacteriaceae bacterium]
MKYFILVSLSLSFFFYGCMQNPPVVKDGNGTLELKAIWNKSLDTIPDLAPLQNAKVILSSQYGMQVYYTGSDGYLRLSHLPAASYNIAVKGTHPNDPTIILVASNRGLNIGSGQTCTYTDTAKPVSNSGIAIN